MLDKAIEFGKEHRKKYRGAKAVDRSCRNGGDCQYCQGNRKYSSNRRAQEMTDKMTEYLESE